MNTRRMVKAEETRKQTKRNLQKAVSRSSPGAKGNSGEPCVCQTTHTPAPRTGTWWTRYRERCPRAPWTTPSSTNPPLKHQTPACEARGESARARLSACQPLSSVAARHPRARLSSRDTGREPAFSQPPAQVNAHSHSKLVNMFFKRKTIFK